MPNDNDFFSSDQIDERLELLRTRPESEDLAFGNTDPTHALLHDLRHLFRSERAAHNRSLQHVWELLSEQNASQQDQSVGPAAGTHLHVLGQPERHGGSARRLGRINRHLTDHRWVALVASLFLCIMVGSLLLIHRALPIWGASSPTTPTPVPVSPLSGYAYPGKSIAALSAVPGNFSAFSWAPDGQHLAIVRGSEVWIWDLTTGHYAVLPGITVPDARFRALSWSPTAQNLAVGTNPVQVVDPGSGNAVTSFPVHAFWPAVGNDYQAIITALAWSQDGNYLAVAAQRANNGCVIQIWNPQSPTLLIDSIECDGSQTGVTSLSWSPDGQYIASADGQNVQIWPLSQSESKPSFAWHLHASTDVSWSPVDPSLVAFVDGGLAQVWNVKSGIPVSRSALSANGVLTWSPDGYYLATASGSQIALWNARTGVHLYTYAGDARYVTGLSWSPAGNYLAAGESSAGASSMHIWST